MGRLDRIKLLVDIGQVVTQTVEVVTNIARREARITKLESEIEELKKKVGTDAK